MFRANANHNNNSSSSSSSSTKTKTESGYSALLSGTTGSCSDPFTNDILLTKTDYAWLAVGSVLLLPIRAVLIIIIILLSWLVAKIGLLFGATKGQHKNSDEFNIRESVRSGLLKVYSYMGLLMFYCAGFSVKVKGVQASREEAPVMVGAPHSSFLEALISVMCNTSPVSRSENQHAPLISECQKFTQTIFVDRRSSASRRQAAQDICDRATASGDWLQLFIFPEGTNTNRKVLIQFKNGAFNPGVPVQPVLIRYPGYVHDSITWTFRQSHSYLFSVWLILAKFVNRVEIEFLPPVTPTAEEKKDPAAFAKRVQLLMAGKLDVVATDLTYHKYNEEYCLKYDLQE